MIKPEHIPTKAMVAACLAEYQGNPLSEVIAAALNAWPNAKAAYFLPQGKVYMLPAPWENKTQEGGDA